LLGVPTASHLIQANALIGKHIRATSSYKYISSMYLNDANTVVTQPQQFLSANVSANYKINTFGISPAIGLRQVISKDAFSNLLINAVGSRYFEAMPRTYLYASVSIIFHP
jgi:outer membrane receptor protein involved in Fe transport